MTAAGQEPIPTEPVSLTVAPDMDGMRADRALARALPDWSREQLKVCFAGSRVMRDGLAVAAKAKVFAGETLSVILPVRQSTDLHPVELPVSILYEDADLLVVDKASGMVTHPGSNTGDHTMVHALLHHTQGQLATAGGKLRPGVVHRLDKDTSGAMVFAKTDAAYHALTRAFAAREVSKEYLAWVHGSPQLESGTLRSPIGRHPVNRVKMAVGDHGKPAHTDWQVERRAGSRFTLLRCFLHSGRTHQIRVHLSHLGYPIVGDSTYGGNRTRVTEECPRLMLHAHRLAFTHPVTLSSMAFAAPIPAAFIHFQEQEK